MPLVLDATIGGASSNSYGTVSDADSYFEGRPGSAAWFALETEEKEQYLVGATSLIDRYAYAGYRMTSGQRLQHPRSGLYNYDGYLYPYTAIARPVQEATFEWALALAEDAAAPDLSILQQFENLRIGSISITPSKSGSEAFAPPETVSRLLYGFWSSLVGQTELLRG